MMNRYHEVPDSGKLSATTDISLRIRQLSPEQKALLLRRVKENRVLAPSQPTIPRRTVTSPCPLSYSQQRLWFLDQLEPGNSAYNVYRAVRLTGVLNRAALHRSFEEIVRRHSILRTTFPAIDGQPWQSIAQPRPFPLPEMDLTSSPPEKREHEIMRLATGEAYQSFNLEKDFSLRAKLLRLGPEDHVLLVTAHHIAVDGWSVAILFSELAAHYEAYCAGKPSALPAMPIEYADFACWHRQWLQGPAFEEQVSYWKKQLAGAPPVLELPTDRPRPATLTFRGARHYLLMPKPLLDSLEALSRREGVTLYMTLAVAFQALLSLYSGQEEIVVGTPIAGRNLPELEGLIGCFSNTLVLRANFAGNPNFRESLQRMKEVALGAFSHADAPFEKLVEELKPERVPNRMLLFQVNFRLLTGPLPVINFPGLTSKFLQIDNHMAKFDIAAELHAKPEGLSGYIEYFTDLFDPPSIANLCADFEALLSSVVAGPEVPLNALTLTLRYRQKTFMGEQRSSEPKPKSLRDTRRKSIELSPGDAQNLPDGATPEAKESAAQANQPPSPSFTLRRARMKDCDFLYHLRKQTLGVYVSQFPGWSQEQQEAYYLDFDLSIHEIIEVDGKTAGAVAIVRSPKEIRYVNLHLTPKFQGLGIGTALFKQTMAEADSLGIPVVFQGVLKTNPALKLYRRLGFEVIEEKDLRYVMMRPVPGTPASAQPALGMQAEAQAPVSAPAKHKSLREIKRKAVDSSS
jgi:ribosomal protein S18 acetylase RimI-like enzyme